MSDKSHCWNFKTLKEKDIDNQLSLIFDVYDMQDD